jgi:hypothetical protein
LPAGSYLYVSVPSGVLFETSRSRASYAYMVVQVASDIVARRPDAVYVYVTAGSPRGRQAKVFEDVLHRGQP